MYEQQDANVQDKVLIVGTDIDKTQKVEETLQELERLVETAGGETVGQPVTDDRGYFDDRLCAELKSKISAEEYPVYEAITFRRGRWL